MDKANGSQGKLYSINWASLQGGVTQRPKPEAPQEPTSTRPLPGDRVNFNLPSTGATTASGSSIKNQVLRIDKEIGTLNKALGRNQEELKDAHRERAELKEVLAEKVQQANEIKGEIKGATKEKAQLQAEINAICNQLELVDGRIGNLKTEQDALLAKEAQLSQQHRVLYDDANGAKNYEQYLKTLPAEARGDDELAAAKREAASQQARRAEELLHGTEGALVDTNTQQALNGLESHFLEVRRTRLETKGDAKIGELNLTQQQIERLLGKQAKVQGQIKSTQGQIAKTDAQIGQTEKNIATLERKIGDLEGLRDEILAEAIKAKQQDAVGIANKIAELEAGIRALKGELQATREELKDLKDLRQSYAD
ncbi:MAG TPA: hypothetical protein V6D00_12915 [Pantanalinema sp.]